MQAHLALLIAFLSFFRQACAQTTLSNGPTYASGAYPFPQPSQPGQVTPGGDGTSFNNVISISGTSSYMFQSLSQTSTFTPASPIFGSYNPVATYNPNATATTIPTNPPVSSGSSSGSSSSGGSSSSKNAASSFLNARDMVLVGAFSIATLIGASLILA